MPGLFRRYEKELKNLSFVCVYLREKKWGDLGLQWDLCE